MVWELRDTITDRLMSDITRKTDQTDRVSTTGLTATISKDLFRTDLDTVRDTLNRAKLVSSTRENTATIKNVGMDRSTMETG